MTQTSKNHHFTPRSILRNFSSDGKKKKIYVYDKNLNKSFSSNITNAGSENHFNTIRLNDKKYNFELLFDKLDGILAKITSLILKNKSLQCLDENGINELLLIIAVQFSRVKIQRTTVQYIKEEGNKFAKELYAKKHPNLRLPPIPNDEEIKAVTINNLLSIDTTVDILEEKDIYLLECKNQEDNLWISDNPIVMNNSLPYGKLGIKERGVEIYFPISAKIVVCLVCKSIRHKLEQHKEILNSDQIRIINTLNSKGKMLIESEEVNFLNHLQIINSSRFIYSSKNEFSQAINFLIKKPKFKDVKSSTKMMRTLPKMKAMPEGEVLVVYGKKTQCMIPITDVESSVDFKFKSTSDHLKLLLKTIENGFEIENIEYFIDKRVSRGMRDMKIKNIDLDKERAELEHKDPVVKFILENHVKGKLDKGKDSN